MTLYEGFQIGLAVLWTALLLGAFVWMVFARKRSWADNEQRLAKEKFERAQRIEQMKRNPWGS